MYFTPVYIMVLILVNEQQVTGQKVTKLLGQKVTIYMFYPGGLKVTTYIFAQYIYIP